MGQRNIRGTLETFCYFIETLRESGKKKGRIIELGTGFGGFSVFLALYCVFLGNNWELYTFDNDKKIDRCASETLSRLGVEFFNEDIFSDKTERRIIDLIQQEGTTVLLCDDGNKIKEFNLFAPYLKSGDYIFAHDLRSEINEVNIRTVCKKHGIESHMQNLFKRIFWISKVKT